MSLMEHAEKELRLAGLYDSDSSYGAMIPEAVLALVKVHSEQGHSGGSHVLVMQLFDLVVNFKPLSPLTSNPSEWMDISGISTEPMWQSTRCSSCFSRDGGKTWYDIDKKESA